MYFQVYGSKLGVSLEFPLQTSPRLEGPTEAAAPFPHRVSPNAKQWQKTPGPAPSGWGWGTTGPRPPSPSGLLGASVASPHAHPGRPRRPPVRKGPAADRPPFPHTRGRPFGLPSLSTADPSPTRRLPFTAAPDALHPPGSQARCPGQGAASSSNTPRKAASMASKEGRAAEPAAARPPSCSDSAAPWQREGAGSAAGGPAASRGRRSGERRQAAGAAGRSHSPAGLPHVLLLLTVAIAQLKAGANKTAQARLSPSRLTPGRPRPPPRSSSTANTVTFQGSRVAHP